MTLIPNTKLFFGAMVYDVRNCELDFYSNKANMQRIFAFYIIFSLYMFAFSRARSAGATACKQSGVQSTLN